MSDEKKVFIERKPENISFPSKQDNNPNRFIEPQLPSERKGAPASTNPPLRESKK